MPEPCSNNCDSAWVQDVVFDRIELQIPIYLCPLAHLAVGGGLLFLYLFNNFAYICLCQNATQMDVTYAIFM